MEICNSKLIIELCITTCYQKTLHWPQIHLISTDYLRFDQLASGPTLTPSTSDFFNSANLFIKPMYIIWGTPGVCPRSQLRLRADPSIKIMRRRSGAQSIKPQGRWCPRGLIWLKIKTSPLCCKTRSPD